MNINTPSFEKYYELLVKWNRAYNLTSITDRDEVFEKHFLDSVEPAKYLSGNETVLDIGCGAGFPGIPLKMVMPGLKVTLIDATEKKVLFCQTVIRELGLKDIVAVQGRVESPAPELEKKFDVVISRATFSLKDYLEMARPYLKNGGKIIAMKGPTAEKEIAEAGIKKFEIKDYLLPKTKSKRKLVIMLHSPS